MSEVTIVTLSLSAVVIIVTICAAVRPSAASAMTSALYALAAVITAVWPWSRKP